MKKIMFSFVAVLLALPTMAQDKIEGTLGTDFVSSYLWRGQKYSGPCLQPTAGLAWKGLSLDTWGSFAIAPNNNYADTDEELDIILGYEIGNFNFALTDYYNFNCGHPFFKYGGLGKSAHFFDAAVGYDFGFLQATWSTCFAGEDGVNKDGNRAYSSYLQLDAPFTLGKLDWTATLGVVPYCTDYYEYDQSSGFHINQIALKAEYEIEFPHFKLPVFGQLMANPSSRDLFYSVGITLTAL